MQYFGQPPDKGVFSEEEKETIKSAATTRNGDFDMRKFLELVEAAKKEKGVGE